MTLDRPPTSAPESPSPTPPDVGDLYRRLYLIRRVEEPEEVTVVQMLRVIRSVRGLNMTNGFNFLLHPFINVSEAIFEDQDS